MCIYMPWISIMFWGMRARAFHERKQKGQKRKAKREPERRPSNIRKGTLTRPLFSARVDSKKVGISTRICSEDPHLLARNTSPTYTPTKLHPGRHLLIQVWKNNAPWKFTDGFFGSHRWRSTAGPRGRVRGEGRVKSSVRAERRPFLFGQLLSLAFSSSSGASRDEKISWRGRKSWDSARFMSCCCYCNLLL